MVLKMVCCLFTKDYPVYGFVHHLTFKKNNFSGSGSVPILRWMVGEAPTYLVWEKELFSITGRPIVTLFTVLCLLLLVIINNNCIFLTYFTFCKSNIRYYFYQILYINLLLSYCNFWLEGCHPHFSLIKDTQTIKLTLCLSKHYVMKANGY
jgi:hypothetical protein